MLSQIKNQKRKAKGTDSGHSGVRKGKSSLLKPALLSLFLEIESKNAQNGGSEEKREYPG